MGPRLSGIVWFAPPLAAAARAMPSPETIALLALISLFIQAFAAWVFVAVLAVANGHGTPRDTSRTFRRSFLALAVGLTLLCVRFFPAQGMHTAWEDGELVPTVLYMGYMGLKTSFGLLLAVGSYQLATGACPRWLRRAGPPLVAVLTLLPLLLPSVDALLVMQAPVLVGAAAVSLHALRPLRDTGAGPRIVAWSLWGLAVSWVFHAVVVTLDHWFFMRNVLALNSVVDLGVQLSLGLGLVVALVEGTHRRLLAAEQERERLRSEIEKDDKLRALGTVLSGVAHELNNPLTAILGYADVLRRSSPTSRAARVLAEQAERCRGIVRNLSALAGQAVHPRETLVLEELAHRVVRGLAANDDRVSTSVRIEPMNGLTASVDRVGIEQVLANLVANALHETPPEGRVTVGGRRVDGGVELTVTDEGAGVPGQLRDRLFEPFFTTKEPGKGTGLGLSIAHAIVRGHEGSIDVLDNTHGPGAVFRVFLPEGAQAAASGAPAALLPSTGEVVRDLLVVDDEAAVRSVVRVQAERRGWQVREVPSAEEALPLLDARGAVLCDLRMPGMGGTGLHDHLARERPDLLARVVFFTGDLASEDVVAFAERCTRPLLHKPFDYVELFARLEQAAAGPAVTSDSGEATVSG